jgi:phenylacetate-coenzyme A ligase PaaK-like adenylate-forming protein
MWDVWRAGRTDSAGIATRQRQRLTDLVTFARFRSRFYAEKYRGLPDSFSEINQLPPITKQELMQRFDDWVTDPAVTRSDVEQFVHDKSLIGHSFLNRYTVCTTSGTTGVPAVLMYDANMTAVITALNVARSVPSWLTGGDLWRMLKRGARTAAVWATDGHFLGISMARKQLLERPSRASRMKIISALSPIHEIVDQLNEFQPAMLNAYATAAALLADEQEAGRLHIAPVLILTSSESLPPHERERIARVFDGAKVRDNYGASEFVAAGYDCGHGWLHINADWVILEPVDENYQPTAPGETSHSVLLTNLANRIQPIIRYEMGDRITLNPDRCECGSSLPAFRVEGRTDDVLRFSGMDGKDLPILPLALWAVMKETPDILRFQAVQTGMDMLEIRFEPKEGVDPESVWESLCQRVHNFLEGQGAAHVTVLRSPLPPTRDPRSGKYRHIWIESRKPVSPALHLEEV